MYEKPTSLDRGRRTHLGILREELQGRAYERFFRWEMDPLPAHVEQALARGPSDAGDSLPLGGLDRLLEPGYLPFETGTVTLPDGTAQVAVLTRFPGATGEMIDWWFGWHGAETERYKLWHPQAHLFTQLRYERAARPDLDDRSRYVGNTSYVDEYVGPEIYRLAIRFLDPSELGLPAEHFEAAGVGTAVCARVGFSDRPVDSGYLVHLVRETDEGCEMRSRFWLGHLGVRGVRGVPLGGAIERILDSPALRRRLLPRSLPRHLLVHCAEEMNHLASFLPDLFAQETRQTRRPTGAGSS